MIPIICGTNRKDANSEIVARLYQSLLAEEKYNSEVIYLKNLPEDFLVSALYENAGKNEIFNPIREKMIAAHKFVLIVPEYNGSFPGVLKTFIDGLSFPDTFTGKKCAMVGLSSGIQGAVLALSHLTDIMNYCGTNVLAGKPKLAGIDKNLEDGKLTNELYLDLLTQQVQAFVKF